MGVGSAEDASSRPTDGSGWSCRADGPSNRPTKRFVPRSCSGFPWRGAPRRPAPPGARSTARRRAPGPREWVTSWGKAGQTTPASARRQAPRWRPQGAALRPKRQRDPQRLLGSLQQEAGLPHGAARPCRGPFLKPLPLPTPAGPSRRRWVSGNGCQTERPLRAFLAPAPVAKRWLMPHPH